MWSNEQTSAIVTFWQSVNLLLNLEHGNCGRKGWMQRFGTLFVIPMVSQKGDMIGIIL